MLPVCVPLLTCPQYVARRIPLPNTLLAHELREQAPQKIPPRMAGSWHPQGTGTWVSDVATYMHTPERPSRDIAIAMHAQGCASLVLALVPAVTSSAHAAASSSVPQPVAAAGSERASTSSSYTVLSSTTTGQQYQGSSVKGGGEGVDGAPRVTTGLYISSPIPLTGFILQGILDESHELLALLSRPLLAQLGGPLAEEWGSLSGSGLTLTSSLCAQHESSLRAARSSFGAHPQEAGAATPSRLSLSSANQVSVRVSSVTSAAGAPGMLGPGQALPAGASLGRPVSGHKLPQQSPGQPSLATQSKASQDSWAAGGGGGVTPQHRDVQSVISGALAMQQQDIMSSSRSISVLPADVASVGPLVASLQEKLRTAFAASLAHNLVFNRAVDLPKVRVHSPLGRGGFGAVYRGLWCGLDVAVKINPQKAELPDSLREAMEIAVMSTVSHPSILCVINFWTDVLVYPAAPGTREVNGLVRLEAPPAPQAEPQPELVLRENMGNLDSKLVAEGEGEGGGHSGSTAPKSAAKSLGAGSSARPSPSNNNQQQQLEAELELEKAASAATPPGPKPVRSLVIVMELCDQGTLEQAMLAGVFVARPLRAGPAGPLPNMLAVLTTLLELALALRHLHSLQLVHADVKPANVLLKASPSDPRGFTAKLCDFGLVKLAAQADATDSARRDVFTGTVSYAPPEMLMGSPSPDASWDVYAFGLIMWNLACGSALYPGMTNPQVGNISAIIVCSLHSCIVWGLLGSAAACTCTLDLGNRQPCTKPSQAILGTAKSFPFVCAGKRLNDAANDVMWAAPQVAQGVVFNDMRPQFPMGFSRQYAALAQRCWASDPGKRPSMDQVRLVCVCACLYGPL